MADNFERQKSTRWVKAGVPSYGDWGDEYDNYDNYEADIPEEDAEADVPDKHESVTPNLVLSIDRPHIGSDDDDDSERGYSQPPLAISEPRGGSFGDLRDLEEKRDPETDSESDEDVSFMPESPDQERPSQSFRDPPEEEERLKWAGSVGIPPNNEERDSFVPPTPTFSQSTFSQQLPETPVSDRSFLSDTDSIQREPESLHVGGRFNDNDLNEIQEEPQPDKAALSEPKETPETAQAPLTLVLSVDRMNLNDDDSSDDSDSVEFRDPVADRATKSTLVLETKEAATPDSDHVDLPLHITKSPDILGGKRPIQTDALDSLINDLQNMERLSTIDRAPSVTEEKTREEPQQSAEDQSDNNLPSLGSIHDMSLPNFEDQSFGELVPETSDVLGELEDKHEDVKKAHELYVSRLQAHTPSVKKAPPKSPKLEARAANDATNPTPSTPKQEPQDQDDLSFFDANNPLGLVPALSPESISTKHLSADLTNLAAMRPPPAPKDTGGDILRRDSTMTTSTFNMGSWKPNTGMYRDQFVNDNDNESQMNMSVYDAKDNYEKFVGNHSAPGYAESFTNSSTLSVPDTVALPSIHEDGSDIGNSRDDDDTSDEHSFDHLKHTKSGSEHSLPSVIKDHRSSGGSIFKEEKLTLPGSLELLPENPDTKEKYKSISSTDTKSDHETAAVPQRAASKRAASSSSFGVSKPVKQKYPVTKWKELTSYSQPIDRIQAFKRAKQQEIDYDTGLQYWLQETLAKTDDYSSMHVGKLAEEAFQNATHTDIRRHTSMAINATSIRNKVSMVKDKMDTTAGFGRRFLNKGKKLMKS